MDAFFAAVEQLRHPELRGQPLIVGGTGDPTARGVVSTASYEARKFGVRSGMPLRQAYRRCPHAVFLPVDYETYAATSRQIRAILRDYAPVVEDVGLDEAFLDVSDCTDPPQEIARAIKRRIRDETGLTCSVGVASNKLLAKIASDLDKPDGLTILTRGDLERRVWPLPVQRIWGIGPKTAQRFAELGIETIGDLAAIPLGALVARFGKARGAYFHRAARGVDRAPLVVHRERKSIGRQITFPRDVVRRDRVVRTLSKLTEEVVSELRERGLRARTVGVKLRFADFETLSRQTSLDRSSDEPSRIRAAVRRCFGRIPLAKKVRLVGVRLSGLERQGTNAASEAQPRDMAAD